MSAERKKLLWIAVSACVFILVLAATGFFLFAPKKGGGGLSAPASVGNTAVPKATDPQDFLMAPPPAPPSEQSHAGGDVIVVYGNKPQDLGTGAAPGAAAAPQGSTAAATGAAAAASPAPAGQPATGGIQTTQPKPARQVSAVTAARTPPKATQPAKKEKVQEYWIQAGSFTSRNRADDLKHALADKGIASLITVKDIAGTSWYRVRVGPYPIKAQAQDWLSKIKSIPDCTSASLWAEVALRSK